MDFKNYSKSFYEDKAAARHMYEYYKMQLQILCWGHGEVIKFSLCRIYKCPHVGRDGRDGVKGFLKWTSLKIFGGPGLGEEHRRQCWQGGDPVNRTENITLPQFDCLSRNFPFERINSLQCYELTRRYSHLLSHKFHHWLMLYTFGQYTVNVQWSITGDGFLTIFKFGIR